MDNHEPGRPSSQASRVPTVVFYDIMHEAATRVRGHSSGCMTTG
jgi:hypothetical protein